MATRLASASTERTVVLPGGTLDIAVYDAAWPLDTLCDFAARNNPRRGFLIVSKVLGRHIPTSPATMQASFDALAARLPADLPGPVVFVGMAETAICLGLGVHAAYRTRTSRSDTLGLHTTRQRIDAEVVATFEEPHSHASAHLLYRPAEPAHRDLFNAARTLVIVDDEVSTGTTIGNLARALAPVLPRLTRIATAVLTDWSGDGAWLRDMPAPATGVALLTGGLTWRSNGATVAAGEPVAAGALGRLDAHVNYGRLGIAGPLAGVAARIAALGLAPGQPVLVLGTGEFTWVPFLLAQAIADAGHPVTMQATTRSPVHVGGAIRSALRFKDNYATGVPNFLYNAGPVAGRRVVICHETPAASVDPALIDALDATGVAFGA